MPTWKMIMATALTSAFMSTSAYAKNMSAQEFVTKASIANQFEIESSAVILEKSQSSDIKSFAQRMVDEHSETGDKLKEVLASSKSNAAPADALDNTHQKLLDKLKSASGNDLDRQYISIQTDAHKEAVALFTDYSQQGQDKALKDFATDTLPALKEHLADIKKLPLL